MVHYENFPGQTDIFEYLATAGYGPVPVDVAEATEAALRAWGKANIPPDFDSTLRSFDELMEAVGTATPDYQDR